MLIDKTVVLRDSSIISYFGDVSMKRYVVTLPTVKLSTVPLSGSGGVESARAKKSLVESLSTGFKAVVLNVRLMGGRFSGDFFSRLNPMPNASTVTITSIVVKMMQNLCF